MNPLAIPGGIQTHWGQFVAYPGQYQFNNYQGLSVPGALSSQAGEGPTRPSMRLGYRR